MLLLSTKLFCGFILVIRISGTSRTDGHSHFSAHLNTYVNDNRTFQLRTGQCNLPNSRLSVIFVSYIKLESKESRTVPIWKDRKKMENSTWLAVNMKLQQGCLKWFEKVWVCSLCWSIGTSSWGLLRNGSSKYQIREWMLGLAGCSEPPPVHEFWISSSNPSHAMVLGLSLEVLGEHQHLAAALLST